MTVDHGTFISGSANFQGGSQLIRQAHESYASGRSNGVTPDAVSSGVTFGSGQSQTTEL
jgi:hypothetical protein